MKYKLIHKEVEKALGGLTVQDENGTEVQIGVILSDKHLIEEYCKMSSFKSLPMNAILVTPVSYNLDGTVQYNTFIAGSKTLAPDAVLEALASKTEVVMTDDSGTDYYRGRQIATENVEVMVGDYWSTVNFASYQFLGGTVTANPKNLANPNQGLPPDRPQR